MTKPRARPCMTATGAPYDHPQAPDPSSRGYGTGHAGERLLTNYRAR